MPAQTTPVKLISVTQTEVKREAPPRVSFCRGFMTSSAVVALLAALTFDASARAWMKPDNYAQSNKSWAWWIAKSFKESPKSEVAILGSSLMVATTIDGDATYLDKGIDQVIHHRSQYLEHLLKERTGKDLRTQALAVGGQMATDTYAMSSVLLAGEKKPDYVVWGIAPRDFVDACFKYPDSSATAKYMRKVADGRDVLGVRTGINERLEDAYGSCWYFYRHKDQVAEQADKRARRLLKSLGWVELDTKKLPEILQYWVIEHFAEHEPTGKWLAGPFDKSQAQWSDNTQEYKARYNPLNRKIWNAQIKYYEKALAYFHDNHIRTYIVNMPITQANEDLMPDGMYSMYQKATSELAQKYGASYVDMNDKKLFPQSNFRDTVHMNGLGATRFWELFSKHWQ